MSSIKDRVIYFYIRSIKRWMYCPSCLREKMRVNRLTETWECDRCEYKLSCKEFESGVVFWFCDECGAFLNEQTNFSTESGKFICEVCDYENDVSPQI